MDKDIIFRQSWAIKVGSTIMKYRKFHYRESPYGDWYGRNYKPVGFFKNLWLNVKYWGLPAYLAIAALIAAVVLGATL